MELKIDIKTLVIGIVLGIAITMTVGAVRRDDVSGDAGKADFGIAVVNNGSAIVRANDGTIYVVDPESEKADFVRVSDGPYKGSALNLNLPSVRTRENRK